MLLWVLSVTNLCFSFLSFMLLFFFFFNLKVIMEPTELHHPGKLRHGILSFRRDGDSVESPQDL